MTSALIRYHMTHVRQSPATGVFLAAGWVAAVLLTFVHGQFIAANRADLSLFFSYLPWVMALLIATLTMPIATEGARGVTERMATLPFSPFQQLSARFQVYWLLLGLWLIGFTPLVVTLYYLGEPDFGPILTGFLGSWLLAAPLLAVSLLVCRYAASAVGGLLGSLAANLSLLLVGMPWVAGWLAQIPGFGWMPSTSHATLMGAYIPFTQGLVNLSAMLLLLAVALLALSAAVNRRTGIPIACGGALLLLIAMVPSVGWLQLDATADSLHTPSAHTVRTLHNQGVPVTFTLHVSQNNPDVPAQVHDAVHNLTNLLLNLRSQAPKQVLLRQNNTDASTDAAIRALQAGITEQNVRTGTVYFAGVEADIGGNKAVMPIIDPARQPVQEYDLMRLVAQAKANRKPFITVIGDASGWQSQLSDAFHITPLDPATQGTAMPSPTDVLVLAQDVPLPQPMLQVVHDYLASGGSVLMMTDAYARAYPQPAAGMDDKQPSSLLPQWGIAPVSQSVVADPALATLVQQQGAGNMPYPFWLTFGKANMNDSLSFLLGMNKVLLMEAGALQLAQGTAFDVLPILTTSTKARLVEHGAFMQTEPALANTLLNDNASGPAEARTVAAMVSGHFGAEGTATGNLIVVADTDWLSASAIAQAPQNLELLTNMLHALAGQHSLANLRAKGAEPRTLTHIEAMSATLTAQSAQTEADIAKKLAEVGPEAAEEAFTLRQQLRDIRAQTRSRLTMLENGLLAINLVLVPVLMGVVLLVQHVRRKRKAKQA